MKNFTKKKYLIITVFILLIAVFSIFNFSSKESITMEESPNTQESMYAEIKGAVNSPGVYEINPQTRIFNLIETAGGLKENAYITHLNLSKIVVDQDIIIIYTMKDQSEIYDLSRKDEIVKSKDFTVDENNEVVVKENDSLQISINYGSLEELQTIPGIGLEKAKRIIEYRESSGGFSTLEQLKEVSGIGDATYEKIKNYISL